MRGDWHLDMFRRHAMDSAGQAWHWTSLHLSDMIIF
jgi:hypothetical protein